jgi:hypothetical protein
MNNNENEKINENNDSTGEKNSLFQGLMFQKTLELRNRIRSKAKALKQNYKDFFVLGQTADPFFLGSKSEIARAKWAYTLWKKYIDTTGIEQVHIRGLHYFIVMEKQIIPPPTDSDKLIWDSYENTEACFKYLGVSVKMARYFGFIPFEGIIDEKNETIKISHYHPHITKFATEETYFPLPIDIPSFSENSISLPEITQEDDTFEDYYQRCIKKYADGLMARWNITRGNNVIDNLGIDFNYNLIKPFHIELWSEKTLPDYIHNISDIDVIVEGSGDLSLTIADDFVKRLNKKEQNGVALYLSDFDPKGKDMSVAMGRKLQWYKEIGLLKQNAFLHPIVLTKDQVVQYDLPRKMLEDTKRRGLKRGEKAYNAIIDRFEKKMGRGYTELQALQALPHVYEKLIRDAIRLWTVDFSIIEKKRNDKYEEIRNKLKENIEQELSKYKDDLERFYNKMIELKDDIEEVLPDTEEIYQQYTEAEEIVNSSDLKEEMQGKFSEIAENIKLPEVIPPKIEFDPPIKCLFDSRRDEIEQTRIFKDFKEVIEDE